MALRLADQYPVPGLTATGRSFTIAAGPPGRSSFQHVLPAPRQRGRRPRSSHGDPQTVWNNAKWANLNTIIVTANYGATSGTTKHRSHRTALFQTVLDQALAKVRLESDIPDNLQWDQFALASFSAGYGGVREILKSATYREQHRLRCWPPIRSTRPPPATDAARFANGRLQNVSPSPPRTVRRHFSSATRKCSPSPTRTRSETADELMQYLGITPTEVLCDRPRHTQLLSQSPDRQLSHLGRERRDGRRPLGPPPLHRRLPRATPHRQTHPRRLQPQRHRSTPATTSSGARKMAAAHSPTTAASPPASPTPPITPTGVSRYGATFAPPSTPAAASPTQPRFPNLPPVDSSPHSLSRRTIIHAAGLQRV